MSLATEARPMKFSQVVEQKYPSKLLRLSALKGSDASRVYLISGPYGTGKTTLARIFARALNCENPSKRGEPCLVCDACKSIDDISPCYREYDCGATGSVEKMRQLRSDMMLDTRMAKHRVVVLDEFHMASSEAQSSLLKVLEEMPSRTFVAMCTTDPQKLHDTVISRAVPVALKRLSDEAIHKVAVNAAKMKDLELSEDTLIAIVDSSAGHARDAVRTVELATIVGEQDLLEELSSAKRAVLGALDSIVARDADALRSSLRRMSTCPNAEVAQAMYRQVELALDPNAEDLSWKKLAPQLFKVMMSSWAVNAFKRDSTVQGFFWVLWDALVPKSQKSNVRDRFSSRQEE